MRSDYLPGWLVLLIHLTACQSDPVVHTPARLPQADSLAFEAYIRAGDSVYARKQGYASFARSLVYYDSAQALAYRSADTLLLAEAIFAKGRVYDAWNKQPQQTIRYFTQAARLFGKLPGQYKRWVYTRHLVAHSYDKIKDSLHTVSTLQELYGELSQKDTSLLRQIPYTAEMALIATEVRAYPLADRILHRLTRRAWIRNNPSSYDYLDHYYLTQSRLDAFWRKPVHSFYLDSLQQVCQKSGNLMDRLYYSECLAALYVARQDYRQSTTYYAQSKTLNDRLNNQPDIDNMQQVLAQSARLAEAHKVAYERSLYKTRQAALWLLSGLLALLSLMSVFLYKRNTLYRKQSGTLTLVNQELDKKVVQVEVLNKEIQHRIKNNLHMIYSLLQMQERKTHHPETIDALQAAQLRIESIAALHSQLLEGPGQFDLTAYLKTLIGSAVNCLSEERNVITHIAIDPVSLPSQSYLPLSLVLNEWVTNTLKHARTNGQAVEINVTVNHREGYIWLEYADNGQVPTHCQTTGLGCQIVTLLIRQMNAQVTPSALSPYHYLLRLPHAD